jgi:hypothetical protein
MKTIARKTETNKNAHQEVKTMKKTAKKSDTSTSNPNAATPGDTPVATSSSALEVAAASPPTAATASTSPSSVVLQLQTLEQTCGYGDPLPDDTREASAALVRRVPSSVVDRVIALAVRGRGIVAGINFDPNAAKAALAAADDADAVATSGQMLVRRAQDQSIRLRSGVVGNVSAIRTSLRGYVKTAQGAPLAQENDELRSLAKQHAAARKARNTRTAKAVNAAKTAATQPEAPTVAPAAPPTPKGS